MKTQYIKDLQRGQIFDGETFAIYEQSKAEDKNGNTYYSLVIGDKTGKLSSKIWNDALSNVDTKAIKEGNVVSISGKVDEYKGVPQIVIMELRAIDETSLEEFVESSMFDAEDMYKELLEEIESISYEPLRKVVNEIVTDKEIAPNLKYWPAATTVHHDFRSGLLQHILEMLTVAKGLERFYPDVDFDILTAGIVLHDLGKIYELDGKNLSVPYTKVGQLFGHIYMGTRLFEEHAKKAKLDEDVKDHVMHLILSHHGVLEYGSPVVPATPEAILLTNIDNVSAKARTADKALKEIGEDEEFGRRNFFLENTKIWNRKKVSSDTDQMQLV
ncbi:HD domain-containing protein [Candidatus Dojkabacteria bacterium]|uniref:HD domain-containing protein n=1 Tax=Candidatus Dojkabacteria bacterium TaxID=2099670 RepID=A0A955I986_9BACT|nr:HD domain-containing protein [Candidatus Dojkabacteria bacterium]